MAEEKKGQQAVSAAKPVELWEKQLSSDNVYDGKIFRIAKDRVELPNGRTSIREVAHHCDGVGVLPLTEDGKVLCVRQYRYCFGRVMLEIPAGKMDVGGETPLETAVRELQEETGCTADEMISLGGMAGSPGCMTETVWLYLAKGLHQGQQNPDEDEFLNVEAIDLDELTDMADRGEIIDGKTIVAVYKARRILGK